MADRIQRLSQLNEWLDAGRIDRSEYEALKRDLIAATDPELRSDVVSDVPAKIHHKVVTLQEQTYRSLGVSREELEEVDRAGFNILHGTEVFTKGVEAHTRMLLHPDGDLRALVELNPDFLPMPIYLGTAQTINAMLEKSEGIRIPFEVRGFMATYARLAWESLTEAGIDVESGEADTPDKLFERLGVDRDTLISGEPRRADGLLPGGFLPDDAAPEVFAEVWWSVPLQLLSIQKLEGRGYEWSRGTRVFDGDAVVVAGAVEKSERKAQQQQDAQIAELAIECAQKRDTALAVARQHGYVPKSQYPSFMWGSISDVAGVWRVGVERGYALPMGMGIFAQYGESSLPLARVTHHELARKLVLSLAIVTGDERGVQRLMAEQAGHQWVKSIITQSRRRRV